MEEGTLTLTLTLTVSRRSAPHGSPHAPFSSRGPRACSGGAWHHLAARQRTPTTPATPPTHPVAKELEGHLENQAPDETPRPLTKALGLARAEGYTTSGAD